MLEETIVERFVSGFKFRAPLVGDDSPIHPEDRIVAVNTGRRAAAKASADGAALRLWHYPNLVNSRDRDIRSLFMEGWNTGLNSWHASNAMNFVDAIIDGKVSLEDVNEEMLVNLADKSSLQIRLDGLSTVCECPDGLCENSGDRHLRHYILGLFEAHQMIYKAPPSCDSVT